MQIKLYKALYSTSTLFIVLAIFFSGAALGQRPAPLAANSEEIEVLPVQGNIFMIATGGSNIAVMTGELGLIVVDSGNIEASAFVVDAIQKLSSQPPRYIVNTSALPGHLEGNEAISKIGEPLPSNGGSAIDGLGIPIVGHVNSLSVLLTAFADDLPYEFWPNNTFYGVSKALYLNGEAIEMIYQPGALTDSDIFVYFRKSDVLVTGDIFDTTSYPHFYAELGGSLQGVIDALNRVIELTVPEFNQQGGTLIVPGHGRISSESDVVEYRDMLTVIRDRFQSMIDRGMTFEEILAMQPSLEYDGIYGNESGEWTTRMFLEAVYEDLH